MASHDAEPFVERDKMVPLHRKDSVVAAALVTAGAGLCSACPGCAQSSSMYAQQTFSAWITPAQFVGMICFKMLQNSVRSSKAALNI